MRTITFLAIAVCLACPAALAAQDEREEIEAAQDGIQKVLESWKEADKAKEDLPLMELLAAMRKLASIDSTKSVRALAKFLGDRDVLVARCAATAIREAPAGLELLVGKLVAQRITPKTYSAEKHYLFLDLIDTLVKTGYLGAFENLKKSFDKVPDLEITVAIAQAFVTLGDQRAIALLFDWANWNKGGRVQGDPMHERKKRDPQSPRGKGDQRMSTGHLAGGNRRHIGTGGVEKEAPGPKEMIDRVYRLLFELVGRDFESWEELCKYMSAKRKELQAKAAETVKKSKLQEKEIRALK